MRSIARTTMVLDDEPHRLSFDEKRQHVVPRPSGVVSLWMGSHRGPPRAVRGPETVMAISPFELYSQRGYIEDDSEQALSRIMISEDVALGNLLRACRFIPHDGRIENQLVLRAAVEIGGDDPLTIIGNSSILSDVDLRTISEIHDVRSFECPMMRNEEMYVASGDGWGRIVEWTPLMETVRGRFAGVLVEWIGMCVLDSSLIRGIRPRGSIRLIAE